MITEDWQIEYRGLLIGGQANVYSLVPSLTGFGMPDVRTSDRARLLRHGQLPGSDFLDGRGILIEVEIDAPTDTDLSAAVAALGAAFRPGGAEDVLAVRIPGVAGGGVRHLRCRPRKCDTDIDERWYHGLPVIPVLLEATDPRFYTEADSQLVEGLPTAGGGLTWPLIWPLSWGTPAQGGTITAVNEGNFDTPVVLRIDGPATRPRVTHVGRGLTLELSLTIADGDFVELDSDSRTVLLNGTASRFSSLVEAGWFDLQPGGNELQFRATTQTAATLTVTWRSAWWL